MPKITQSDLIMEYFTSNPQRDIPHAEICQWLYGEYRIRTGKEFADPDRGIRMLCQQGKLIKVSKGVYKYDSNFVGISKLAPFTEQQKEQILIRDGYKCVICGKGSKDGIELQVDHIKPQELGGTNDIDNGQTLCASHNYRKKKYNQTESGKKMFINMYRIAKIENDELMTKFFFDILCTFEKYDINGHIEWEK